MLISGNFVIVFEHTPLTASVVRHKTASAVFVFYMPKLHNTYVYIDGFNLYYGALKNTPYKWLDVAALCNRLLTTNNVIKIKYFTAKVSSRPNDPQQPVRQEAYLRALETIPNLEIIYGQFRQSQVRMRLVTPLPSGQNFVEVIKTEEKGSDVNLATHMVNDGHFGRYDAAVLISNDSDLLSAVKIIRHELGKVVGMIYPSRYPSNALRQEVTFLKRIRQGALSISQFPTQLTDANGTFNKPPNW